MFKCFYSALYARILCVQCYQVNKRQRRWGPYKRMSLPKKSERYEKVSSTNEANLSITNHNSSSLLTMCTTHWHHWPAIDICSLACGRKCSYRRSSLKLISSFIERPRSLPPPICPHGRLTEYWISGSLLLQYHVSHDTPTIARRQSSNLHQKP